MSSQEVQRAGQAPSSKQQGLSQQVTSDIECLPLFIVNAYLYGAPNAGDRQWVLVDAGIPGTTERIAGAAAARFGTNSRPAAIILTHGHFDHVGALEQLAKRWDAPIYAHEMEMPYLTDECDYAPPDPTVGGGAMARVSFMYPRRALDLRGRVQALPSDGSVPGMPGWRSIHTPGHTPGHVSLFRDSDRCLIAGDAFVTVKQESAVAVLTKRQEVHGPPAYFTPDWQQARRSVETLAALQPSIAATGHGVPMRGEGMQHELAALARNFEEFAVPSHGRYVGHPIQVDGHGKVVSVPPPVSDPVPKVMIGVGLAAVGLALLSAARRRR